MSDSLTESWQTSCRTVLGRYTLRLTCSTGSLHQVLRMISCFGDRESERLRERERARPKPVYLQVKPSPSWCQGARMEPAGYEMKGFRISCRTKHKNERNFVGDKEAKCLQQRWTFMKICCFVFRFVLHQASLSIVPSPA